MSIFTLRNATISLMSTITLLVSACGLGSEQSQGLCRKGGLQIEDLYARIEIYRVFGIPFSSDGPVSGKTASKEPVVKDIKNLALKKTLFDDDSRDYYSNQDNVLTYDLLPERHFEIIVLIDDNCWAEVTWSSTMSIDGVKIN